MTVFNPFECPRLNGLFGTDWCWVRCAPGSRGSRRTGLSMSRSIHVLRDVSPASQYWAMGSIWKPALSYNSLAGA